MSSAYLDTIKILKKADKAYYNTGKSIMTDSAYDKIKDKLAKDAPKIKDLKVRKQVVQYLESTGTDETSGEKVKHNYYLPSLNKIKDDEPNGLVKYRTKVKKFWRLKDKPLQYLLGPKFDGSSVRHVYDGGQYKMSVTRGNGNVGRVVTAHCKELIKLGKMPSSIPVKDHVEIRSEICVTRKDFASWKGKKVDGYMYKEARNSANSYLVAKTIKKDFAKAITVVAFDCFDRDGNAYFSTKFKAVKAMSEWGFSDLFYKHMRLITETMDVKAELDRLLEQVSSESFVVECDGVVIEANSTNVRTAMRVGNEDKRPTHAMAYKYGRTTDKTAQVTTVTKLFWTAAADGARVPNVEYKPILVGNTKCSNALVHNAEMVEKLGVTEGCSVKVVRAGGVIPQVVEVVKKKGKVQTPLICGCGQGLKRIGPDLYCLNKECAETNEAKFSRACRFMDIDGLGSEGERKLFKKYGSIAGLLSLTTKKGLQATLGNAAGKRVSESLDGWLKKASWADLMVASGAFTRPGFSLAEKQLKKCCEILRLKKYAKEKPGNLSDMAKHYLKSKLGYKTSNLFIENWPNFVKFMKQVGEWNAS